MRKRGNAWIAMGLLLIAAALCITAYNLWDENRAGQESGAVLEDLLAVVDEDPIPTDGRILHSAQKTVGNAADEIEYPDYVLNPNMEMPVKIVDGKEYIGILRIPSLNLELPVFSEWNYKNLKSAPCRYTGTVYRSNMVICAHNYSRHFGNLKNLNYGDEITFTDVDGNVFSYQTVEIETLKPMAVEEMTESEWDFTLFTCTIGGRTRVTVRCERA